MRFSLFVTATLLLFSSCGKQPMEKFLSVNDRTWEYNSPKVFSVNIKEPGVYKMEVLVRYTEEYPYSNLWLGINEKSPDASETHNRFNIPLFDVTGRPYGSFAGKLYDRSYPDGELEDKQLTLRFPKAGEYQFALRQNMRVDKLDGISELGIRLIARQ